MSGKRKKPPRLSETQTQTPETLAPEELAERRAAVEAAAAEAREQRGFELLREGAQFLGQRRAGEAAEKLEVAASLLPDNVDVAINLGGAYILQNRYRKAIPVLEHASRLAPDNAMVWVNLAAAYLGRLELAGPQQQRNAIMAYERALEADPQAPNVHYNLALIYKDRRDWQQARAEFQRALEVNPDDRDARHWLERLPELERQSQEQKLAPEASEEPPAEHDEAI